MAKIKTESVVEEIEAQMAKILNRCKNAVANQEKLEEALEQDTLGTLEEELGDLEKLWPYKPFPEQKAPQFRRAKKRAVLRL